ncbi:MAG: bifunctional folylpolyglutamate synthase/dihydrofolate synthase [Chloroflexi bacterium]|nr:bifunctional folylpolyglutamate synthase/dihydrofolate synthase [Chloroflexota bacterium]
MTERMTYNEAIDALYGFINYELKRQDRYSPEVMTLERPAKLMELLGNPEEQYPIIHVTGTKGKGSVGAMCASVLRAAGYKVGMYSSPHLQDFRERFQINGNLMAKDQFVQLVEDLLPYFHAVEGITWFEVITALAFEHFAREKVDVAVIEVGLGGRLDATNVVTPLVSVITSLSFDHTYLLGNTLSLIAAEKGGIIKPGIPVVSAPQVDEARETLEKIAEERNAPLTLVGRDWTFEPAPPSISGQTVTVSHHQKTNTYTTNLNGEHQAINMTVALAALEHVKPVLQIPDVAVRDGLRYVNWPGRFEVVGDIVLDAAHNRASARWLRETLTALYPNRELVMVFGAKADKDITGMLEELLPVTDSLIITQAVDSRAESPDAIAELAQQTGFKGIIDIIPPVGDALEHARQLMPDNGLIFVTGSLYVVGEARTVLQLPVGHLMPPPSSVLKQANR